jgi:polar amino acid transport system ATP-binding protein
MVFQNFELFPHISVVKNIMLAQEKVLGRDEHESKNRSMELLQRVGLSDQADKYPGQLSGGQQQRVAIARAILADCPILILDEATSALDSVSEHEVQLALKALTKGRTSITIAHRLATIKSVDRILVFSDGNIKEQGTHEQLINTPNSYYKKLFDMQVSDLVGE